MLIYLIKNHFNLLNYLHERRILHRDLKPQNIFLKAGRVRLGDFGIAKVLDSTKDFANTLIGTPYFMSPELFKNKPYSYESDIWALGCILYEMWNLKHAFDAQSINGLALKILKGNYPSINTMYSKSLRDLIDQMLSQKKSERPTIVDIINKPIIKKRIIAYMKKWFSDDPEEKSLDIDDMNYDSLKEQAEKLELLKDIKLDSTDEVKEETSPQKSSQKKKNKVMKDGSLTENMRNKTEIVQLKKAIKNKKKLQEDIDQLVWTIFWLTLYSITKWANSKLKKQRKVGRKDLLK